jgi:hypothetical protein
LVAVALGISVLAYQVHEGRRRAAFRRACWSLHVGEASENVERELRDAAGGGEYPSSDRRKRVFHLDSAFGRRLAICTVTFDESGRLIASRAKGGRPK